MCLELDALGCKLHGSGLWGERGLKPVYHLPTSVGSTTHRRVVAGETLQGMLVVKHLPPLKKCLWTCIRQKEALIPGGVIIKTSGSQEKFALGYVISRVTYDLGLV